MDNMRPPNTRKHDRSDDVASEIRRLQPRIDLERSAYETFLLEKETQGRSTNFRTTHNEPARPINGINALGVEERRQRYDVDSCFRLGRFKQQAGDLQRRIRQAEESTNFRTQHNEPARPINNGINVLGVEERRQGYEADSCLHLRRFKQQAEDLQRRIRQAEEYHSDLTNELRIRCQTLSQHKQSPSPRHADKKQKSHQAEDAFHSSPKLYERSSPKPESSIHYAPQPCSSGSELLRCAPVATELDAAGLSEYQCLVRLCMEFFECSSRGGDHGSAATASSRSAVPRQVGLRCLFCRDKPTRAKGGVYFPKEVSSVYQAAQNMARNHLLHSCAYVPERIRERMQEEQAKTKRRSGGKQFWEDATTKLGLYDCGGRLYFGPKQPLLCSQPITKPDELPL